MVTSEVLGLDPHAHLAGVLLRSGDHPNKLIDELLPDRWAPSDSAGLQPEQLRATIRRRNAGWADGYDGT
jgi:hypothetical protein